MMAVSLRFKRRGDLIHVPFVSIRVLWPTLTLSVLERVPSWYFDCEMPFGVCRGDYVVYSWMCLCLCLCDRFFALKRGSFPSIHPCFSKGNVFTFIALCHSLSRHTYLTPSWHLCDVLGFLGVYPASCLIHYCPATYQFVLPCCYPSCTL